MRILIAGTYILITSPTTLTIGRIRAMRAMRPKTACAIYANTDCLSRWSVNVERGWIQGQSGLMLQQWRA